MSETEFARAERLWRENCKLQQENSELQRALDEAREHLSEALAGRDQWRKTHLELADVREELENAKAQIAALEEKLNGK